MIMAWVLYRTADDLYRFEERNGNRFDSTVPGDWGLSPTDEIILVQQNAQFLGAWVRGEQMRKW